MSTLTNNYKLVKPELTDSADITVMNGNWDTLDAEVNAKLKTDLSNVNSEALKQAIEDCGFSSLPENVPITNGGTGATTAEQARTNLGAAPMYGYGTEDLQAGVSELATGKLYFVYE